MKRGIDIDTTNNSKKHYRAPVLEVVNLDRDIILMGNSGVIGDPPIGMSSNNFSEGFTDSENTSSKQEGIFPDKQNPFGGGTPDYQR
ncbi:hypothetical protein ACT29H_00330 [Thermophagus sp. OGC60D27]|uniref:hypothetical protein n=1 Tax=Thermophagus sp. OGC60D27 TaxID=3458415 RepID=UPI0040383B7F